MRSSSLLARLGQTRAILLWERAYAAAVPVFVVAAGFTALALFGAFEAMPPVVHGAALLGAGIALAGTLALAVQQFRLPDVGEEFCRLETDAALPPGTLSDLTDVPFGGRTPSADPLWARHIARLKELAGRARPLGPRALVDRTDPYGLRVAALLALLTGALVAGPSALPRITGALAPDLGNRGGVTADIWIEPPAYTRLPPKFLARRGDWDQGSIPPEALAVPAGSVLHARVAGTRVNGRSPLSLDSTEGREVLRPTAAAGNLFERPLLTDTYVVFRGAGGTRRFPVSVVPDQAPAVSLTEAPSSEGGTRTMLRVLVEDDYGVEAARIRLALAPDLARPPDAPRPAELGATAYVDTPALRGEPGAREVSLDLTDHPWAGLPVLLSVEVTDGAGQSALSEPRAFTLPARTFYNPLSRAVVAERQSLALAPDSWRRTLRLLDALTFAPQMFAADAKEYLLLRTAYHEVSAGEGENIEAVVDSFWPLAIALEDEGLTLARQRLEAAQEALRNALANGAPQEEVDRLVEELRQAMNDYLAALANSGDADAGDMADSDTLEGRDLNDILDEIAALRRQGDSAEARARLAELEQLLQNLRISRGQGGDGEGQGQGQAQSGEGEGQGDGGEQGPLGETGDLIDRQRRLSDDTFSARRGDRSAEGLGTGQRALADETRELAEEGTAGSEAFRDAADAMADAANALARGDLARGQARQEEALEYLRQGGQALADALLEERAAESGAGREGGDAAQDRGLAGNASGMTGDADRDPLGRRYNGRGPAGVEIPDLADPARIRDLTDQLRRRLSNPDLPEAERRYIERLLRRF